MTEKVRAALFDILGPIEGLFVLDAYAGSGALGIEALSRGATKVIAVEAGHQACSAIRKSVDSLQLGMQYSLEPKKVESWLAHYRGDKFGLIFAMPPYSLIDDDILSRIGVYLEKDAVMVVEFPRQSPPIALEGMSLVDVRTYGDPKLAFYKRT